jgi:DNA-binding CsgD family transcriptional regulator
MSREVTLFGSVLARLPHAVRDRGERATLLRAAGYDEGEIAAALGVNRRTLQRDRVTVRDAIVAVLVEDGYSVAEIARDLRVAESEIHVPNRGARPNIPSS